MMPRMAGFRKEYVTRYGDNCDTDRHALTMKGASPHIGSWKTVRIDGR